MAEDDRKTPGPKMVVTSRSRSSVKGVDIDNIDAEIGAEQDSVIEGVKGRRPAEPVPAKWNANHTLKVVLKVLGVIGACLAGYWGYRQIWG